MARESHNNFLFKSLSDVKRISTLNLLFLFITLLTILTQSLTLADITVDDEVPTQPISITQPIVNNGVSSSPNQQNQQNQQKNHQNQQNQQNHQQSDPMRAMYRFSDPIPTSNWLDVVSLLYSYQQLAVSHRFGPYGIHKDDKDYMKMMKEDIPELKSLFTTPKIFDLHNYNTTIASPPMELLNRLTIAQINSNLPYKKINEAVGKKIKEVEKFDQSVLQITSDGQYIPSNEAHEVQSDTYNFINNLLTSSSPYIRLEVTSTYEDAPKEFVKWVENYSSNNNLDHILMKFSSAPRTTGGYNPNTPRVYHMIIYIEPDQLVQYGKHFSRMSDHGNNAGFLLLVIMALIIGSQLGFQYWEQTAQRSYNQFIVLALWLVPLGVALLDNFRRFLIIWWCYTCLTALVLSLLFIDLNPLLNKFLSAIDALSDDNTSTDPTHNNNEFPNVDNNPGVHGNKKNKYIIPQRYIFSIVYKYLLLIHKLIMLLSTLSIIVFFLDIFGVFQLVGLEPHMVGEMFRGHEATAAEVLTFLTFAFYGLFYSLYFGVLNRDIATVVIPELTLWSSRFKSSREFRLKQLHGDDGGDDEINNNNQKNNNNNNNDGTTTQVANVEMSTLGNDPTRDRKNPVQFGFDEKANGNTWDNVGSILGDASSTSSTIITSTLNNTHNTTNNDFIDEDEFFNKSSSTQPLTTNNNDKSKKQQQLINKENSCGICHEHLHKKSPNNTTTTTSPPPTDLPTINEIRNRLRRQNFNGTTSDGGSGDGLVSRLKNPSALCSTLQGLFLTLLSTIIFTLIDLGDYLTGGTGNVNLDSVTLTAMGSGVAGNADNGDNDTVMYTISAAAIEKNKKKRLEEERYRQEYNNLMEEDEGDEYGNNHSSSSLTSHNINGFASNLQQSNNNMTHQDENILQTQHNIIFKLPCSCIVHDICLRGFMLLGKHNTCPSCNEISTFDVFISPWDSVYDNYKNFLDTVKYFIAVNPLLLFLINIILYFFW